MEINGRRIAASMNGMPHGQQDIGDNGFDGHFCIHFLGSRVHRTGRVDPSHQEAIFKAAEVYRTWLTSTGPETEVQGEVEVFVPEDEVKTDDSGAVAEVLSPESKEEEL